MSKLFNCLLFLCTMYAVCYCSKSYGSDGSVPLPVAGFNRQFPSPIDSSMVWDNYAALQAYVNTSAVTYAGQMFTVAEVGQPVKLYILNNANALEDFTTAELPQGVVTNNASGVTLSGTFTGDGSGLTGLNAETTNAISSIFFNSISTGAVVFVGSGISQTGDTFNWDGYLPLAGGTMTGNINMNEGQITNVSVVGLFSGSNRSIDFEDGSINGDYNPGGTWTFSQQPTIPGYLTSTGAVATYLPLAGGQVGNLSVNVLYEWSSPSARLISIIDGTFDGALPWSFTKQPDIPGYINTNNLSTIAGSGLSVIDSQLVVDYSTATNPYAYFTKINNTNTLRFTDGSDATFDIAFSTNPLPTDGIDVIAIESLDLSQLNDVTVVSPTTEDTLVYNGSTWVNTPRNSFDSDFTLQPDTATESHNIKFKAADFISEFEGRLGAVKSGVSMFPKWYSTSTDTNGFNFIGKWNIPTIAGDGLIGTGGVLTVTSGKPVVTGTASIDAGATGAEQHGYVAGGSIIIEDNAHGAWQRGYFEGTALIDNTSLGSSQEGVVTSQGTAYIGVNVHASSQRGYILSSVSSGGPATEQRGFFDLDSSALVNGRGATQIGYLHVGSTATNLANGAVQILGGVASNETYLTTSDGIGSLLLGPGTQTNAYGILANGLIESKTGFKGDGSSLTNLSLPPPILALNFGHSSHDPAGSGGQTYFFDTTYDLAPQLGNNASLREFVFGFNGRIIGASIATKVGGTLALNPNGSTVFGVYNKTTDVKSAVITNNLGAYAAAVDSVASHSIDIPVDSTSRYAIYYDNPGFGTPPTTVRHTLILYVEKN